MSHKPSFLVVGADSLVGREVLRVLADRGECAYGTTRRADTLAPDRLFLDFESPDDFSPPADVEVAFVIAAATNYERCERDPRARLINVELTPKLIKRLLAQKLHVLFVSTNSVFGGERPWPHEDDPHDPRFPYAQQKHEAELAISQIAAELHATDRLSIVRLTKILDAHTPPLPSWVEAWNQGKVIHPFGDLIFAPMSVQYAGSSLATLGEKKIPGHLHLSGAENITYVQFAFALAEAKGLSPSLIKPTTATERGVHIPFKPTYSGLGMERTSLLTGLQPQSLESVVSDLLNSSYRHNL